MPGFPCPKNQRSGPRPAPCEARPNEAFSEPSIVFSDGRVQPIEGASGLAIPANRPTASPVIVAVSPRCLVHALLTVRWYGNCDSDGLTPRHRQLHPRRDVVGGAGFTENQPVVSWGDRAVGQRLTFGQA